MSMFGGFVTRNVEVVWIGSRGLDRWLFKSSRRVVASFETEDRIAPLEGFYTKVTMPWSGEFSRQESGARCRGAPAADAFTVKKKTGLG